LWQELHRAREESGRRRTQLEVLAAREQAQAELRDAARRDVTRLAQDEERLEEESRRLDRELTELQAGSEMTAGRLADLDDLVEAQRLRENALRRQPAGSNTPNERLPQLRDRLSQTLARHEWLSAQLAAVEEDQTRRREELWRELAIGPEDLPDRVDDVPDDDEIRRLRARAAQYADADFSVVEECRELAEREARLRGQVQDLRAAGQNLEQIIRVADSEMETRFATAFAAVSQEFERVFHLMLGGGEARLEPVPDDGGVEMRVQLPGTRLRSSAAFSGGERALIASSLLFGVLKIRPTPFCILDEVDAALDESNVDRYLTALRDLSQDTQMIVVTHNRATMAAADVLYGLTMDDEGVSNVLSLRLDTYQTVGRANPS
jgi:chromosome segregation protein